MKFGASPFLPPPRVATTHAPPVTKEKNDWQVYGFEASTSCPSLLLPYPSCFKSESDCNGLEALLVQIGTNIKPMLTPIHVHAGNPLPE